MSALTDTIITIMGMGTYRSSKNILALVIRWELKLDDHK